MIFPMLFNFTAVQSDRYHLGYAHAEFFGKKVKNVSAQ